MNITIFEHSDPRDNASNGIENIVNEIMNSDIKAKINFVGSTNDRAVTLGKTYLIQETPFRTFTAVAFIDKTGKHFGRKVPDSLRLLLGFLRYYRSIKANVIHAHRIELGLISLVFWPKSNLIQFLHNESASLRNNSSSSFWKHLKGLHKLVEKIVLNRAKKIIVFNKNESQRLRESYSNVFRFQTWYDETIFYPQEIEDSKLRDESALKIIWVGRLETEKNPLFVLHIARELKRLNIRFKISIVGSGSLRNKLIESINDFDLIDEVILVGRLSAENLGGLYRESDIFVSTSIYEGSPTALTESLACGLFAICFKESDPDEIIDEGVNGTLITSSRPEEFAQSIIERISMSRPNISNKILDRQKSNLLPELISIVAYE